MSTIFTTSQYDYWVEIVECDSDHIEAVEKAISEVLGYDQEAISFPGKRDLVGVSWVCSTYSQAQTLISRIKEAGAKVILTDEFRNILSRQMESTDFEKE